MFRKIKEDLKAWSRCDLSWLGKINAVKMTLLPRLLYLFRSLPIPIKKISLYKLQSKIIRFVWGKKGHRCSKELLFCLKTQGGLGLPKLWWYHQAAQLTQFSMVDSRGPKSDWISLETQAIPHHSIDFLLWRPPKQRPSILLPSLSHSLALCDTLHKHVLLTFSIKPLAHLFHNPQYSGF